MSHGLDSGMWKFVIAWTIAAFGGMLVVIIALKGSAGGPCRNLGADEARRYIEEKRPFILDVRSAAEQSRGVIRGAVCLPLNQLGGRLSEVPQDRPVLVYCASGMRSRRAASLLSRQGGQEVVNLQGGLAAWVGANLPISKG